MRLNEMLIEPYSPLSPDQIFSLPVDEESRVDLLNLSVEEQLSLDSKRAFEWASEAKNLAESCGHQLGMAAALFNLGECSRLQSNYESALRYLRQALQIYQNHSDQTGVADALRATGFVYNQVGDNDRALEYLSHALKIDESTGNESSRAKTLRTIGIIHSQSGDKEQALEFFKKSLLISKEFDDQISVAKTLNNMGVALKNLRRYDEAIKCLNEGLLFFRKNNNVLEEASTLKNLGTTFIATGNWKKAEESLSNALKLSRQIGYPHGEMKALLDLGTLCINNDKLDVAKVYLNDALACATKNNTKPAICDCHEGLARLYKKMRDYRLALEHFETFRALEREVVNEGVVQKLKALETNFQLNEAQREAEIHRLKNVELANAYEELRSLNEALQMADQVKNELLAQLEKQNQEDPLTALFNRRYLDSKLGEEFRRAQRHRHPLSVALIDVDFFKKINDVFSHSVGDETLKTIAHLLKENCRETDVVARYGGEEFVVVLIEMDLNGAIKVCEKIRLAVENYDWSSIHPDLKVTISLGVSDDINVASPEKLLSKADANLYNAKNSGRNKVCY